MVIGLELSKSDFAGYIFVTVVTSAALTCLILFLAFRFGVLDVNRFAQPQQGKTV